MYESTVMPASLAACGSTRVSTTTTRMPAWLALAMAGTISFDPEGVTRRTLTPVWIRFSMICICLSTSTSRSAACTVRLTPRRLAASRAPRSMSMKKGLFKVFRTRATRGAAGLSAFGASPRGPHPAAARAVATNKADVRFIMVPSLGGRFKDGVYEHGGDDHDADHDLLEERKGPEEVEPVAQHPHDEGADQGAVHPAHASGGAGPARDGGREGGRP